MSMPQKNGVDPIAGGRGEHRAADRRYRQTCHDAPFVGDALDQGAGRQRDDRVCPEEAELDQHRFRVAQVKDILQMRDQDVVQSGYESHMKNKVVSAISAPV